MVHACIPSFIAIIFVCRLQYATPHGPSGEIMTTEVPAMVASGVILNTTKVWGEHLVDWTPFEECKGQFGLADIKMPGSGCIPSAPMCSFMVRHLLSALPITNSIATRDELLL